jgi:thiol-disulfide isomerase/thioredoxin
MKIFSLIIMMLVAAHQSALAIDVGDVFPKIEVSGSAKDVFKTSGGAGKVTVINFWATWCQACKVELKEMKEEFVGLISAGDFEFAMIALDTDAQKAVQWIKENIGDGPWLERLYHDPEFKVAESLGVDEFPMTIVLAKDGKIAKVHRGFREGEGSTKKIAELVRTLQSGQ